MTVVPGFFAAFVAGVLSFASPCVLPLIPVYLSFITGESASALKAGSAKRSTLLTRSALFVLGFSIVFVILAIAFRGGMSFAGNRATVIITKIAGVIVILLAVNMLFDFLPFLRADFRPHLNRQGTGTANPVRAVLMGMAFAAGWTPCVGPVLAAILAYAGGSGNSAHAALLLASYAAGLGLPFIAAGLFLDRLLPALNFLKRHALAVRIVTVALLVILAIPMIAGTRWLTAAIDAAMSAFAGK
jgi:cytochrome c-type biogenesis protein